MFDIATLDSFDRIDGKPVLYNSATPHARFPVVSLLDHAGNETQDEDSAAGGVVEIGEEQFMVFTF